MKDHQILRFVSPKRNDWYRRRSWLPDEPSPLALYDVTPDTVDTWSDDSDDYDWSDIRYDGMSDDSITASHGSSSKTSDFSDEDVTYEETATRRKESDPRRKECSSAPEPNNRKAVHHASNDKTKPSEPKDSALTSSEKTACNSAKAQRATKDRWCNSRLLQMLTEGTGQGIRKPNRRSSETSQRQRIGTTPPPIPAKSSSRSSKSTRNQHDTNTAIIQRGGKKPPSHTRAE